MGQTPATRVTKSIRLSRFAAHNAFHHCEQCHHYCEASPAMQVRPSLTLTLAAEPQTFSYTHTAVLLHFRRHLLCDPAHERLSVLIMRSPFVCFIADGLYLSCFHLLFVHAGGRSPAPVYHSQIQRAALCLQPAGQPPGEHASASGLF